MVTEFYVSRARHYSQARGFQRVPADFPVQVLTEELRVHDRAADLSESGIGVRTTRPLAPMSLVSLRMEPPYVDAPIEVLGRVMWAGERQMGIRFEQTEPRLMHVLTRLRQDMARI